MSFYSHLVKKHGIFGSVFFVTLACEVLTLLICLPIFWFVFPETFEFPLAFKPMVMWAMALSIPIVVLPIVTVPVFRLSANLMEAEVELGKQAQEKEVLEASNRLKTHFLNAMSLEFRTPLNNIIGFSELLLMMKVENLSDKQKDYLTHIHDSGAALSDMINDLLKMSEVTKGDGGGTFEETDVHAMLNDCIGVLGQKAHGRSITLKAESPEELIKAVIDESGARRCLMHTAETVLRLSKGGQQIILKAQKGDEVISFAVYGAGLDMNSLPSQRDGLRRGIGEISPGNEAGAFTMAKAFVDFFGGDIKNTYEKDGLVGVIFDFPVAK